VPHVLSRSTETPHAWRSALAIMAINVWIMIGLYWIITGPAMMWLLRELGPFEWSPPTSA